MRDDDQMLQVFRWLLVVILTLAVVGVMVIFPYQLGMIFPFYVRIVVAFCIALMAGAVAFKEWWPILFVVLASPFVFIGVMVCSSTYRTEAVSPEGVRLLVVLAGVDSQDYYLTEGSGLAGGMCRVGHLGSEHTVAVGVWRDGHFIIEDEAGDAILTLPGSCP